MRVVLSLFLILSWSAPCMGADAYPVRPVRAIVAFGPGSGTDIVARLVMQQLSELFGKTFIVDNRTGASGTIGAGIVARSAPDGYTLFVNDTAWTVAPGLYKSLPYDIVRDFSPISMITRYPTVVVIHPSLKANSLAEFIALAQASPGKLNYGSAGAGGALHLASELFNRAANINTTHVPFKGGGGEAMAAVIGGQIDVMINAIQAVIPHVNSGKLRALAITTDGKRSPALPEVPSISEAGIPGMTFYVWFGLVGPARMPKAIINRLNTEVVKAIGVRAVKDRFLSQGGEVVGNTPVEFSRQIISEMQRWARVIKDAGIVAE